MVKIRVGILTVPFNNNYGGFLQAYALMKVLKDLGCQPYIIMRRHNLIRYGLATKTKIIIKSFLKAFKYQNLHILRHPFESHYFIQGKEMQRFVDNHIKPQTSYFYSWEKLRKKLKNRFDAIIVGSDQVWRSIYVPGIENYFFSFAKEWDIRKVAYAASFGTTRPEYTEKEIKSCGSLLKLFDSVSVRELGALQVFNKFNWNVEGVKIVLDPTLLLDKTDYESIIRPKRQDVSYLFAYVLDKTFEKEIAIQNICDSLHLDIKSIANIQKGNISLPSIEEWLEYVSEAQYTVTDSFHGMVFSIIFHTPFVVLVNKERGADRFESLLNMLDLKNRLCYDLSEIKEKILSPIDWGYVDFLLQKYRKESIEFLSNSIINKI